MKKLITTLSIAAALATGAFATENTIKAPEDTTKVTKNNLFEKLLEKSMKSHKEKESGILETLSEMKSHTGVTVFAGTGEIYGNINQVVKGTVGFLLPDNKTVLSLTGSYTEDSYDITYAATTELDYFDLSSIGLPTGLSLSGGASLQYANFQYDTTTTTYTTDTVLVEDGNGGYTEETTTVPVTTGVNKTYDDYLIGVHMGVTESNSGVHFNVSVAKGVKGDLAKVSTGVTMPLFYFKKSVISGNFTYEYTQILNDPNVNHVDTIMTGIYYSF